MAKNRIKESELVLNEDGSVYHLHLMPEQIADTIITVGDPDRVSEVSKHFDRIEHKVQKREFFTHTGYIGSKRLTVISTGIGTDNIDIVLNELDALVNIDLKNRCIKDELKSLDIVRVGTSGTLQADIPIDSILLSTHGVGLDGMLNYYAVDLNEEEKQILQALKRVIPNLPVEPTIGSASQKLIDKVYRDGYYKGITVTQTGFYGPQGRVLRAEPKVKGIIDKLSEVSVGQNRITNLEMETAGIYGLGNILGHHCLAVNVILANRKLGQFTTRGKETVALAIKQTLESISA